MSGKRDIVGVVVLYRPPGEVGLRLARLEQGGLPLVAVFNEADPESVARLEAECDAKIICLPTNAGLAHALNLGIEEAIALGADRVLLLDQDSEPHPRMARELSIVFDGLLQAGKRPAAVGPVAKDIKGTGAMPLRAIAESSTEEVHTIITSGSLISAETFHKVGGMWEELFIDDIDHEWCFRARECGFGIYRACEVLLDHDMGDSGVMFFGTYKPLHRSPFRHYHIVRNTLAMLFLSGVPAGWRLTEALKLLYRIPVYVAVSTDRIATSKAICKAVRYAPALFRTRPAIWRR